MYRDYDPIPFTWSQLQWHKAAIFIPWLVIGVAYVRYRLFCAIAAHVFVVVFFSVGCGFAFALGGEVPRDGLDFAYTAINFNSRWLLLASLFSLPLAVIKVAAQRTSHFQPASDGSENLDSEKMRQPAWSDFTVEKLLTFIAITGQLTTLYVPTVSGMLVPGDVERLIARRGVDSRDSDRPEEDLIAHDISITGRWQSQTPKLYWIDIVRAAEDGSYWVGVGTPTEFGPAIEKRTGNFRKGELILNEPTLDFLSRQVYTKLYVVRWHGQEMLISSVNVEDFNKCREGAMPKLGVEDWKKFVIFRQPGQP